MTVFGKGMSYDRKQEAKLCSLNSVSAEETDQPEAQGLDISKLMRRSFCISKTIQVLFQHPYRLPTAQTLDKVARGLKVSHA